MAEGLDWGGFGSLVRLLFLIFLLMIDSRFPFRSAIVSKLLGFSF